MKLKNQQIENKLNLEKNSVAQAAEKLKSELKQAKETLAKSIEQAQILENRVTSLVELQLSTSRLDQKHENVREKLLEKANERLSLAQDFRRQVDELKTANDLEEMHIIQPAREELKSLNEQRLDIEQKMMSLNEKLQMLEEDDRKFYEEQTILRQLLSTEYENNLDIIASRKAEQENIKQLMEDEKVNFACEVESKLEMIAGIEEEIKHHQLCIEDAKSERKAAILKRQDELRIEHQKRLNIEKVKLHMYERAIEIMAESDEKVKLLRESRTFMVDIDKYKIPSNSSNKYPRNVQDSMVLNSDERDDETLLASVDNKVKTKARSIYGQSRKF